MPGSLAGRARAWPVDLGRQGMSVLNRPTGSPRAARQVGFALRALLPQRTDPQQEDCIPWWRVLRTSGQIALKGDPERPENQRQLLRDEGVIVDEYTVDMTRFTWRIRDGSTGPL